MALTKFTIDGEEYWSYDDTGRCTTYLRPNLVRYPIWNALQQQDKELHLIFASQTIDRIGQKLGFIGEKTDPTQPLSFPRTGIPNQDSSQIPLPIEEATCLLATSIAQDPTQHSQTNISISSIKSKTRGKDSIEYFSHQSNVNQTKPLQDEDALALIRPYLLTHDQASFNFSEFSQPGQASELRLTTNGYF